MSHDDEREIRRQAWLSWALIAGIPLLALTCLVVSWVVMGGRTP